MNFQHNSFRQLFSPLSYAIYSHVLAMCSVDVLVSAEGAELVVKLRVKNKVCMHIRFSNIKNKFTVRNYDTI